MGSSSPPAGEGGGWLSVLRVAEGRAPSGRAAEVARSGRTTQNPVGRTTKNTVGPDNQNTVGPDNQNTVGPDNQKHRRAGWPRVAQSGRHGAG
nr:hypothetical protein GCM10020063_078590 [Dactylosporangium thailandense]